MHKAFELIANTDDLGPTSTEACNVLVAHVSILQRVGMFQELLEVRRPVQSAPGALPCTPRPPSATCPAQQRRPCAPPTSIYS